MLITLQCEFILGLNFVFKIYEGKICFVNFDNRDAFFGMLLSWFSSRFFFFSLNKFNYFGMKILSNSTMKYNAMQTLFVAIILIIKRSIVLPVRNVIHIFVLCE